jgi:tetratricopeptide (TPR) repeat protein
VYCELGRFDQARQCATAALTANRESGNQRAAALSLCHLARAAAAGSGVAAAEDWFRQAIQAARDADDRHVEAWALDYRGTALQQAGLFEQAALSWQRALALFEELHDPQAVSLRSRLTALLGG